MYFLGLQVDGLTTEVELYAGEGRERGGGVGVEVAFQVNAISFQCFKQVPLMKLSLKIMQPLALFPLGI